jgi:cytochrome c biogenesis protein CcdA
MKWWPPLVTFAVASSMFVFGLGYGVIMVGVPTPHASASVAAAEAHDSTISVIVMLLGILLGLAAVVWLAVVAWDRRSRQTAQGFELDSPRLRNP